jgi:hypothetical protein
MTDDFESFRESLRESADGFRPRLDPEELAASGRRRQRRNVVIGGAASATVLAVAALVVPALLRPGAVPAFPAGATSASAAPVPTTSPSGPASSGTPGRYPGLRDGVPTNDWKTFSSKEYPITFAYPSDWTVDDDLGGDGSALGAHDGCDTQGCILFVNPPADSGATAIELLRGAAGDSTADRPFPDPALVTVLGALPDKVVAWASTESSTGGQAVVVRDTSAGPADYALATRLPSGELSGKLGFGATNPLAGHPEASFSFATNTGNLGGSFTGKTKDVAVAIIGSARPNPAFAPTVPADHGSGTPTIENFDKLAAPAWGAVRPDASWKTLTVKAANLSVTYPPNWKVSHALAGIWSITAPSGYAMDLLTGQSADACDGDLAGGTDLGGVPGLTATAGGVTGPVVVRWLNGGEFPAQVQANLHNPDQGCYQRFLDVGGDPAVYLGSADNLANPSQAELGQAVAIVASARHPG